MKNNQATHLDKLTSTILAKVLGAFFYYPPDHQTVKPLIDTLCQIEHITNWQNAVLIGEQCQIIATQINNSELNYQFSLLFEGQGSMSAPPWGSIYLDQKQLLMGESQERYRQFLQQHGVILNTGINEPEDQFGLMLMAYAMLLENNNYTAAKQLINEHLLIWSPTYLKKLKQNKISPFYRALAMIAEQYLQIL
ncbi:hypothetical protein A9G43_02995 [Gilliamella sp. Occ3-1]|uniref:TorD/DmsD family molecular chaperone n=1 Tax=Gilliamella sp. Occ3-1 TaxID=3120253 RepID=UPI00080E2B8B|nr:molecular chaperone [Gilliamella apicola]OCG72276.1 hypothetical protein A9G43_02995 [Gilliamella apicola]